MARKRGEHGKMTTQRERVEELMAMDEDTLLLRLAKRHLVLCDRLMDKSEGASARELVNIARATSHLVKQRSEHSGGVEIGIADAAGAVSRVFGWAVRESPVAVSSPVVEGSEPVPGVQQGQTDGADNGDSS